MASVADPLGLLRGLVADRLGPGRVAELVDQARVRVFGAFLLRHAGAVPRSEEYAPKVFTTRSGVDYFRPDGWVQVWLTQIDDDPDFLELREWPVAYHGTDSCNLGPILEAGLRKPGELPSVQMVHGNAGAGPDGAIYTSPSLWLASHPVYSTLLDLGNGRWAQFVFKVRVRPGSYTEQASTLSSGQHWGFDVRLDPNFPHNHALEWLVGSSSDVKVVGLMFRELGAGVDPEIFGELAAQVAASSIVGPEYCWTAKLREALRGAGFTIDLGQLTVGTASVEWRVQVAESKQSKYWRDGILQSHGFTLPDFGIAGWLEIDFTGHVPVAWVAISECLAREGPISFDWIEASSGFDMRRIAHPSNAVSSFMLVACRPHADQIVLFARWISTRTTVSPITLTASTAFWKVKTSVFCLRDWVAETQICSPCFDLAGGSRLLFSFRLTLLDYSPWCQVDVYFNQWDPQQPFAYTVQLGDIIVDFVYEIGCRQAGSVWAPLEQVCKGGEISMRLTITRPA